ncbi:MAG TPA: 2'-5' RNA ligase family protein [Candidatus Udaeobacter sp.]|nr:2'-5' RNA ligase family protein [Candidatus Udaeobacter sp.]
MSGRTVIAYWLIPAEPARSFFQGVVDDLVRRYDAPLFEPHVTIHVGLNRAATAESAISQAARACKPIKLKALKIGHSSEFIKTLFVQFALNAELRQLNEIIRNAVRDSSHYELKPHLSLLYKKMPAVARRALMDSIMAPVSEVTFDALKAVRCISPTQTHADVEAWRVVTATDLFAQ